MTDQIISPLASVSHISLLHRPYGPRVHMAESADGGSSAVWADAAAPADLPADAPESFSTPREAADYFASLVDKKQKPAAESAEQATADKESAQADAGPETVPGEEPEGNDPEAENLPPVERPRSWSKDDDDEWNAIPRERQEKIAAKELAREADINQRISKAAKAAEAADAKAAQAEQARQSYEARQAAYTQALETALQTDFGDIRTMDDVRKLQAEDPFRFQAWQVRQMELSTAQAEKQKVDGQKAQERQSSWANFVRDESAAFADSAPEYKAKKADYDTKAAAVLREIGFTEDELNKLASGEEKIPLFDRRIQRLLFDRIKLSEIKAAPKAVAKPDLPPVQRPGTSRPSGQGVDSERIQALNRKPELTVREATELVTLQQRSQRRAS